MLSSIETLKWALGSASGHIYTIWRKLEKKVLSSKKRRWSMQRESSGGIQMSVWLSLQAKSPCLPRSHVIAQYPTNHFLFLPKLFKISFYYLQPKHSLLIQKNEYTWPHFFFFFKLKLNPCMTQKLLGSIVRFSSFLNTFYWW